MRQKLLSATAIGLLCLTPGGAVTQTTTTTYTYDGAGRLTNASQSGGATTYEYDDANNRKASNRSLITHSITAGPDSGTVATGQWIDINAKSNDSDSLGHAVTITGISQQGLLGNAVVQSGGATIRYTAGAAAGPDTVKYTVSDGQISTTGTISLTVTGGSSGTGSEIIPTAFTASSSYGSYTGLTTAGGMRDGQFLANNTIHGTNYETDAWIKADLGSAKTVGSIKLAPADSAAAGSWGASYLDGAIVEYSTNNSSWTTVGTVSSTQDGVYVTVNMGGVSARYIRVRQAQYYLGLGDFRVYSTTGGGTQNPPPTVSGGSISVANAASNVSLPLGLSGGTATSVAIVSGPSQGSAFVSGTQIRYSPYSNLPARSDSLTFTASNAYGTSNVGTVSIAIAGPTGTPPNAQVSSTTVANPSSNNLLPLTILGGTPTSLSIYSGPTSGTASVQGTKIYYTPYSGLGARQDNIAYTATNQHGSSNGAVIINVSALNHPPVAAEDWSNPFQSTTTAINPKIGDTDPDQGDQLTITSVGPLAFSYALINGVEYNGNTGYPGPLGTLSVSGQNITYTAPYLCANFGCHMVVVFYYTISDGKGGTATGPHVIAVYSQP